MDAAATFWVTALVAGAMGSVIYIIARDKRRFLARFELAHWRENYYLRMLPNFLQALHDHHFKSPFPQDRNGASAVFFRYRTRGLLRRRPKGLRSAFLDQHIILFSLLEILRPYLSDFVLSEELKIAGKRVAEMEDTSDRDRLLGFIDAVRAYRADFHKALTEYDHRLLVAIVERRLISTLRAAHAIFQEHGYTLLEDFTVLRRWEQMTGSELAQELPALPRRARKERIGVRGTI